MSTTKKSMFDCIHGCVERHLTSSAKGIGVSTIIASTSVDAGVVRELAISVSGHLSNMCHEGALA